MRRKNWRAVIVGFVLGFSALGFFCYMLAIAPRSNDPVALMQTVGTASGVVSGISLVMIVFGLIGKKVRAGLYQSSLRSDAFNATNTRIQNGWE